MTVELNTLSPKKWSANYGGSRPTIDSSNGVRVGDYAIDVSTSPNQIWHCESNAAGTPLWLREGELDIAVVSTTPYTAARTDNILLINCTSAGITINLPASNVTTGKLYNIKKIDSSDNVITIDANGSELIDGLLQQYVNNQYTCLTIVCDGTGWNII